MKLKAKRSDLLHASQFAASVCKTNSTMVVLSHLLIRVENSGISLIATNLEVQALHSCAADFDIESGEVGFCIPAKLLIDILSLSASEDVEVNHAANRATITLGARKFTISTLPPTELPLFPEVKGESFEITAEVLGTQLARVSFAVSESDDRQILHNVSVAFVKNELRFIACNGRRGAMSSIPLKGTGELLLPPMLTSIVEKFCKNSDSDVVVMCSYRAASFKFKNATIEGRLSEGVYPNLLRIIPSGRPHHCTLDREQFIFALKAIVPIQSNGFKGVKFEFNPNAVRLSCENPENSSFDEVPASTCAMEPIVLPSDNLIDALTHLSGDSVTLEFVDHLSAVVLQELDYLSIIMPMRLT